MPTSLQLISRAMRLVSALGSGETPTADAAGDGLVSLNAMLDQWWIQRLSVYRVQEDSYTWPATVSRTIGPAGDFTATNPVRVESAAQTLSSIDYPIRMLTAEQYRAMPDKTTATTLITHLWHEYRPTASVLYAYPVPSASCTVNLRTWTQLQSFATLTEAMALPPGYENAIAYNLAVMIAPEYARPVPQEVRQMAANAVRLLKTHNLEVPQLVNEAAHMTPSAYFDWRTG